MKYKRKKPYTLLCRFHLVPRYFTKSSQYKLGSTMFLNYTSLYRVPCSCFNRHQWTSWFVRNGFYFSRNWKRR